MSGKSDTRQLLMSFVDVKPQVALLGCTLGKRLIPCYSGKTKVSALEVDLIGPLYRTRLLSEAATKAAKTMLIIFFYIALKYFVVKSLRSTLLLY